MPRTISARRFSQSATDFTTCACPASSRNRSRFSRGNRGGSAAKSGRAVKASTPVVRIRVKIATETSANNGQAGVQGRATTHCDRVARVVSCRELPRQPSAANHGQFPPVDQSTLAPYAERIHASRGCYGGRLTCNPNECFRWRTQLSPPSWVVTRAWRAVVLDATEPQRASALDAAIR